MSLIDNLQSGTKGQMENMGSTIKLLKAAIETLSAFIRSNQCHKYTIFKTRCLQTVIENQESFQ